MTGSITTDSALAGDQSSLLNRNRRCPIHAEPRHLMPYLAPYLEQARKDKDALDQARKDIQEENSPTLFVEGPSDKIVLEAAIKIHAPSLLDNISIKTREGGAGASYVKDMLVAWVHGRNDKVKAVGLLDDDDAGQTARNEINAIDKVKKSKYAKVILLSPSDPICRYRKATYPIPVRLEELYSPAVWQRAMTKGWLADRNLLLTIAGHKKMREFCDGLDGSDRVLLECEVNKDKKIALANYVCALDEADKYEALQAFDRTVKKIAEAFGLSECLAESHDEQDSNAEEQE